MKPALKDRNSQIIYTRSALFESVEKWKSQNLSIGFVPTMGALHEGHLSLVKRALENSDRCVVSIFVNPTQFAPHEDFSRYPRQETHDTALLEAAGAHLVYLPSTNEIYPGGPASTLKAGKEAQGLEGNLRPTHFDGVVTVIHSLFEHVQPDIAVFGEKDFQQLQVIREMVSAQNLPVEVIGAPIVRDEYGLALSSRNAYLSNDELQTARTLNVILSEAKDLISTTQRDPSVASLPQDDILKKSRKQLLAAGFNKVDYVESRWNRFLAAAWIGKTRLIDNMEVDNG